MCSICVCCLTRFLPSSSCFPSFVPPSFLSVVCLFVSALPSGPVGGWQLRASLQLAMNQNRGKSCSFLTNPFNGQSEKQLALTCQLSGSVWLTWIMGCFTETSWPRPSHLELQTVLPEWEINTVSSHEIQGLISSTAAYTSWVAQTALYIMKTRRKMGRFDISKQIQSMQNSLLTWNDKSVTMSTH